MHHLRHTSNIIISVIFILFDHKQGTIYCIKLQWKINIRLVATSYFKYQLKKTQQKSEFFRQILHPTMHNNLPLITFWGGSANRMLNGEHTILFHCQSFHLLLLCTSWYLPICLQKNAKLKMGIPSYEWLLSSVQRRVWNILTLSVAD